MLFFCVFNAKKIGFTTSKNILIFFKNWICVHDTALSVSRTAFHTRNWPSKMWRKKEKAKHHSAHNELLWFTNSSFVRHTGIGAKCLQIHKLGCARARKSNFYLCVPLLNKGLVFFFKWELGVSTLTTPEWWLWTYRHNTLYKLYNWHEIFCLFD